MCAPKAADPSTDHPDEFGTSVHRSYPPMLRILAMVPSTYQLRIAKISHDPPDQSLAEHARTIGSVKKKYIFQYFQSLQNILYIKIKKVKTFFIQTNVKPFLFPTCNDVGLYL